MKANRERARFDSDRKAKPKTEIRAVVPAGARIIQPYNTEVYIYREVKEDIPKE